MTAFIMVACAVLRIKIWSMETSHYENNIISTILIGADTLCTMDKDDDSLAGINEFIGEATDGLRRIADELKETQADKSL